MTFIAHCTSFDNSHTCQGTVITVAHAKVSIQSQIKVQTLMYTPHTTAVQRYWMSGRHLLQIIIIYSTCGQQVYTCSYVWTVKAFVNHMELRNWHTF